MSHHAVLAALKAAGMDSLPGAGAEILVDRVRRLISKGKCGAQEWLDIMHEAHKLYITTSATMMFGHVETLHERMEHLIGIREVQAKKPATAKGFLAFIPWTFQDVDTLLTRIRGVHNLTTPEEYIRMIAISRIMLPNVKNIQASWLTVGKQTRNYVSTRGPMTLEVSCWKRTSSARRALHTVLLPEGSRRRSGKRGSSLSCATSNMNGATCLQRWKNRL